MDFTQPEIQTQMAASLQLFRENKYVVPETMNSWWEAFQEYTGPAPSAVRPCATTALRYIGAEALDICCRTALQWGGPPPRPWLVLMLHGERSPFIRARVHCAAALHPIATACARCSHAQQRVGLCSSLS